MPSEPAPNESQIDQRPLPSTSDWNNIGGTAQPQSLIAPIYFGDAIYAFAQSSSNTLALCKIDALGRPEAWRRYGFTSNSSPATAVARTSPDYLGVARLASPTTVEIDYIRPSAPEPINIVQASVVGGLPRGTVFAGPVQLVRNADSRLEAFALDTAGRMWQATEVARDPPPANWTRWQQIPGPILNAMAQQFQALLIDSGPNAGLVAVVALSRDGKMYRALQMPQQFGFYGNFAVVGTYANLSSSSFIWAPTVVFDATIQCMIFAAYNDTPQVDNSPVVYCFERPNSSDWKAFAADPNAPMPEASMVLTSTGNTTYLIGSADGGQVNLTSQAGATWSTNPQNVGAANPAFTLNLTAVANDNKIGLFQPVMDGTVAFINYLPR